MKEENKYFIYDSPSKNNIKRLIKKTINGIQAFFDKCILNLFVPKRKNTPKFDVAVCTIFKNEAKYLKEWIEFHKIVGVQHFYLYNNNSTDDYTSVLDPYIKSGLVSLIQWEKNYAQMEAYQDCVAKFSNETKWLGFIDVDEYIVPNKHDNVYDFLKAFEKNRPAVVVYWKMFGTSGLLERAENGLVLEDFTVCWRKFTDIGKCFYNTKYKIDVSEKNNYMHHRLWTKIGCLHIPPVNEFDRIVIGDRNKAKGSYFPIQINHYFTKSYKEYQEKKSKGDVYFKLNPHDEEYFYMHEKKCADTDFSGYKYLIKLKQAMRVKDNG